MNKFTKFAIAGVAALTASSVANAGVVTHTVALGPAQLDWVGGTATEQVIDIPKYDGLGVPASMEISFEGSLIPTADVAIFNFSAASSSNASIFGTWDFNVAGPGLIPDYTFSTSIIASGINVDPAIVAGSFSTGTPSINVVAPAGTLFPFTGSTSVYMPTPASFIGPGVVSVVATNLANVGFSGIGSSVAFVQWEMLAQGTLTVSYIVPAPAPLALLGIGLVALGFVRRQRA